MARSAPRRVRISPVDNAWLRMDAPGNLMMIVGVVLLRGGCDLARLKRVIETHLLQYHQFRSRVAHDAAGAWWEEDPHFDLDQHLVRIGLPGRGGKAELQRLAATLAGQALDPTRPLWQFHLVENYRADGFEGHALIVRIHHAIGDGIALVGVFLSLTTGSPEDGLPPVERRRPAQEREWWEQLLRPFTDATVRAIDAAGEAATRILQASGALLDDPDLAGEAAGEYARVAAQVSSDAAALALMTTDTRTSLKGRPGGSKAVAWAEPLPLADVKVVGKALGCSVNDVLLSCATGAIRAYLLERGDDLDGAELRAMVPVNLRAPGKASSLGNRFGLVPLLLPIGIEHPIERLYAVHARMSELKGSYQPLLAFMLLAASGLLVKPAQDRVMNLFARKTTAVMTNVPGPPGKLGFCGSTLEQMLFWVPQSGRIGVGVSILSYGGGVQFGLVSDKRLCPEPQRIIDRCAPEFAKLLWVTMMLPWGEPLDAPAPPARQSASPARSRAASGGRRRGASAGASASRP